jgi:hypothetical protein
MTDHLPHPAVAPALAALAELAAYEPTSALDLADVLKSLHGHGTPNLIDSVVDVLWHLADQVRENGAVLDSEAAEEVADHLAQSGADLSASGCDHLDRARAATGHYDGSTPTGNATQISGD